MTTMEQIIAEVGAPKIAAFFDPPISVQAVYKWAKAESGVPQERCPTIEWGTHGRYLCDELRPDLTWVRVPDPDWPHPKGRPLLDHTGAKVLPTGDRRDEAKPDRRGDAPGRRATNGA